MSQSRKSSPTTPSSAGVASQILKVVLSVGIRVTGPVIINRRELFCWSCGKLRMTVATYGCRKMVETKPSGNEVWAHKMRDNVSLFGDLSMHGV